MNIKKVFFVLFLLFFLVSCKENEIKNIKYLEIESEPIKLEYLEGEELDFNGLSIKVIYSDDSSEIVNDYTFFYDDLSIGENIINVRYQNYTTSFIIKINKKENEIKNIKYLEIESEPIKLEYLEGEELDFNGLSIKVIYSDDSSEIVNDYTFFYDDLSIGENIINVRYQNYTTSFIIKINKKEKVLLNEYLNYYTKTIKNIDYSNYKQVINNVKYGVRRDKDFLICYDENTFIKTNQYGFEIAVDKYGKVVEKAINVSLPKGGFVLSSHGIRNDELKNINIGDYVLFLKDVAFIYECDYLENYNYLYLLFYDVLNSVNTIENIDEYNIKITKLNDIIISLNDLYYNFNEVLYDKALEELEQLCESKNLQIYNIEHSFTYSNYLENYIELPNFNELNYREVLTYDKKLYIGGFRDKDTLVYYDKDCYRERNSFGYEVAIDKNGIVIEKDFLVDLPEEGFILSGHTSTADFIINNISIKDKIIIKEGKVYIYRDDIFALISKTITKRNELMNVLSIHQNNSIPHDYQYIYNLMNQIDKLIGRIDDDLINIYYVYQLSKNIEDIDRYINIIYSQLVTYNPMDTKGIWYYPFNSDKYDDTSIDGIKETMKNLKRAGFNEIIINPFYKNFCLFESDIYNIYEELYQYDYGQYGHDFLKCFIEIAHQNNISVNAFTQTFCSYIDVMKVPNEDYYQLNYGGERAKGSIYYYDICNDDVQNMIIDWYKELVTKYNFDKIEYDIIRYPSSNLYNYNNIDIISNPSVIVDPGHTKYSIDKFMKLYQINGDFNNLFISSKELRVKWLEYKEEELIKFITNCSSEIKKIKPDIIISAAVLSDSDLAKKQYLQDFRKWLSLEIIDEVEPMLYTSSNKELNQKINTYLSYDLECNIRFGLSPRLDVKDLNLDFYQMNATSNIGGYILFSSSIYYNPELIDLMSYNHHIDNFSDLNSVEEIRRICYNECIAMINDYYEVKNNTKYNSLKSALNQGIYLDILNEINKLNDSQMKLFLLTYLGNCE